MNADASPSTDFRDELASALTHGLGAVAALAGGAGASVAVLVDSDWLAFWGNPCIPAVLTSLVASVVVTLLTPASSMSREQALEMITRERESRPTPPPLPIGKRHTSRG